MLQQSILDNHVQVRDVRGPLESPTVICRSKSPLVLVLLAYLDGLHCLKLSMWEHVLAMDQVQRSYLA